MSGTQGRGGRKQAARSGREKTAGAGRKRTSAAGAPGAAEGAGAPGRASGGTSAKRGNAGGGAAASAPDRRAPGTEGSGKKGSGKPGSGRPSGKQSGKAAGAKNAGAGEVAAEQQAAAEQVAEERGPRPPRVTVAAVLTAVEGIVIAALGGYELIRGIFGEPDSTRQAVFGGLTVLALAALPLAAAFGLWRQRRWSRGPSMITQILALPVAWAMASAGGVMLPLGISLGAVALVALVCVLSPSTAEALGVGPGRTA